MGNSGLTGKNKAAIYCRISRDPSGEGIGVGRQAELCTKLAELKGLEVVKVYSDNDIGASHQSRSQLRPEYQQMLSDAKAGSFTHILAYSNSRLTRRVVEFEDLVSLNENHGISFATVDTGGELDLSTPQGLFVARMLSNVAALESAQISRRQKDAFAYNAAAGKPKIQRQRAFGWEKDGITQIPEEVALIREGIQSIISGESLTAIARDWESRGIRTAANGEKWNHATLSRVLTGWKTAGVRTVNRKPLYAKGELVMGIWEPIITLAEREQALSMLRIRTRVKKSKGTWRLTGLVSCGICGGKMYGQLTGTPTYACKPGSGHCAITASKLEEHVQLRMLSRLVQNRRDGTEHQALQEDWEGEGRLTVVIRKIEEIRVAWNADVLSLEEWISSNKELTAERDRLIKEREAFYLERARPKAEMRSTSELLEWMQDLLGVDHHALGKAASSRGARWGEADEEENVPWSVAAYDPENQPTFDDEPDESWQGIFDDLEAEPEAMRTTDSVGEGREHEIELMLRREIKTVVVMAGKRGREGWGAKALEKRVKILWRS